MYYLYILQCKDGNLYTGITTDLERRVFEHNNSAKGAKYTSARRPVKLVYFKEFENRSIASKEEFITKQLSRKEKLNLIKNGTSKKMTANQLQKDLRTLKNPEKAKVLAGFFKTGKGQYGEGDKFLGISVPQTRTVVKEFAELSLVEIAKLLQSAFHEERLASLLILTQQYKKGNAQKQKSIFEFYLKNAKRINSWDLVDLSADKIVGAHLFGKSKKILFKFIESESLWERRIAMVSTFHEIKLGKSETALAIAEKLLNDKEDLMHKAVGWMLREVGKRCSQKEEEKFLQKHWNSMPRTTLRYAIERFDEKKRQQYLKRKL